jgi:hypothetical protein
MPFMPETISRMLNGVLTGLRRQLASTIDEQLLQELHDDGRFFASEFFISRFFCDPKFAALSQQLFECIVTDSASACARAEQAEQEFSATGEVRLQRSGM